MAEHVDLTSKGRTKWTFRTYKTIISPDYFEWGAESIREEKGGIWGWERRGTARPFTLSFVYANRILSESEFAGLVPGPGPFSTVERGYAKIWVVSVFKPPETEFHESLILDVIMSFRHRGHGYTLSHKDGLTLVDP